MELTLELSFFHGTFIRFAYNFFSDKDCWLNHDFPSLMGVINTLLKSSNFLWLLCEFHEKKLCQIVDTFVWLLPNFLWWVKSYNFPLSWHDFALTCKFILDFSGLSHNFFFLWIFVTFIGLSYQSFSKYIYDLCVTFTWLFFSLNTLV